MNFPFTQICLCTLAVFIYITSINVPIHFRELNEKLSIEKFKTLNRISVNAYGRSDDDECIPEPHFPCVVSLTQVQRARQMMAPITFPTLS